MIPEFTWHHKQTGIEKDPFTLSAGHHGRKFDSILPGNPHDPRLIPNRPALATAQSKPLLVMGRLPV